MRFSQLKFKSENFSDGFSQFFANEVPMWTDKASTAVETVKAISIMGAMNNKGTLVHSYLEDGFPALFQDCATVAGWAFLERYMETSRKRSGRL